jgi:TetR/AcrR family transcriptional regulator, cholesterol catabolism regulator
MASDVSTVGAQPTGLRARNQVQRRARIIKAAAALASRGGIEAMQMRTVAERAGVALGTLYRYFPSKMDLVVAVISEELDLLQESIARRPLSGTSPAERAVEVLMRATRGLMREPELADALVRSMLLTSEEVDVDFGDRVDRLLIQAALGQDPGADADPHQLGLTYLLQSVWVFELLQLLKGKHTLTQTQSHLELAAERLLHDL